jgi:hypothetical protein
VDYFRVLAQMMQQQGRGGDTVLAHITPDEARMLKRRGGAGTRNPVTGLLEFYDADSGQGGDPSGGDSGGGGGGDSGGGDSGWGGGDWGSNVDFGGPMGTPDYGAGSGFADGQNYGAPSVSVTGGGFAGDNAQSGMANVSGSSTFGAGFAGDNAESGMANVSGDSTVGFSGGGGYNDGGGNDSVYVPAPVAPAAPAPRLPVRPSEAFMRMLAASQNIGVPQVSIANNYGGRSFAPPAAVMAPPVFGGSPSFVPQMRAPSFGGGFLAAPSLAPAAAPRPMFTPPAGLGLYRRFG